MKYGLLGRGIGYSLSPFIHHQIIPYGSYHLLDIPKEAFDREIKLILKAYRGINVTIPYKESIVPYLDGLSLEAEMIGAVNTVLRDGDKLIGHNTDYFGILECFKRFNLIAKRQRVVILGTGGGARAVVAAVREYTDDIAIISRSKSSLMGIKCNGYRDPVTGDLLINTTPIGQRGEAPLVGPDGFKGVLDLIYSVETPLLKASKALGLKSIDGLYMLVAQAVKARELWDGVEYSIDGLYARARKYLMRRSSNIYIVGMPGAGKSTFGRRLASAMDKEFIDLDRYIEDLEGRSIPEIFELGEEYFRERERYALTKVSKLGDKVVALGGGALGSDANRRIVKGGIGIFLRRPLEEIAKTLEVEGRPMLKSFGLEELYLKRYPQFVDNSSLIVDNFLIENAIISAIRKLEVYYENCNN